MKTHLLLFVLACATWEVIGLSCYSCSGSECGIGLPTWNFDREVCDNSVLNFVSQLSGKDIKCVTVSVSGGMEQNVSTSRMCMLWGKNGCSRRRLLGITTVTCACDEDFCNSGSETTIKHILMFVSFVASFAACICIF